MQPGLVAYFVEMLTAPGDLVFDPFAGSNTTGYIAEKMNRKWVASEAMEQFAKHSAIRFKKTT
jgi:site-specific DNA-methyltransferase (cytosine-N4-specific)